MSCFKKILFTSIFFSKVLLYIRAIRTRTVDLLGKRAPTDYYQYDLNSFKDPTCLFLHWAPSLTDINIISLPYFIFFLNIKKKMAPRALIHYVPIQGHYQSVSKKGYPDVGVLFAYINLS